MSTVTEKRVIDMQFKNSQFEQNAAKTLDTISKLKESLNFTNSAKGLNEIEKSANSLKFDRLTSSVEDIQSKFSALNIAAMTVFQNLVNKAVNAGTQIANAFTLEPITSGFNEYELKLGSIQTILANTASRQKEVSQDAIQELNEEAAAAVTKNKELQEEAIENLQETQAAQDKALRKQFEAQNKAYEKQAAAQTKAFEKQASERLEAFEEEAQKEIDTLNDNYSKKYEALESEEQKELELSEANYNQKYQALVESQKNETKLLEKTYKEQTKAYEKEMKDQVKALEEKFDQETEALEEASDEQLEVLEKQQKEQTKALEKQQKEELKAVQNKYDEQVDLAEDAADAELDALEDKYDEQLDLLEDTTDAQMEQLEKYYDDAYDALEKSQEKESKLLEQEHDARLDMYHEEYMEKLKVADEDRYNKIKAIDNEINSIKNLEKAEKAEKEEAEKRRKLQELQAAVNNADTEVARLRAERNLADFREKLAEESREKEREDRIAQLEAQKDGINEAYELEKDNIKAEYEQKKDNEQNLFETEKDNLKSIQKEEQQALKEQESSEKEALKKSIADQKEVIKEQYDYEKELAQERAKLQKETIAEQKEAELEALKEQQESAKELLEEQQKDQEEALKKQIAAQKSALKEQHDAEKESLQELQQAQKEAVQERYQILKEGLDEQQELNKQALKDQNEQEKAQIQETYNERKSKLTEQQNSELTALEERKQKERDALNEKIENERESLKDRQDAEREAMKDSQEAQQEALDKRQKAELKAMKQRHKEELANIETEKNARIAALNASAGKTTAPSLEEVNEALDELNEYADQTIYNFADMTHNIGTFTAAGVGLDDSVKAIKGIANLAALSGSNAQQASTAMYQLSQALATGTVKLQDWHSVENAGMGGAQFKESLKETARVHGIAVDELIAKEGSFQASLQHGWLTSEVLLETLAKLTGDLTDEQLKSMGYSDEQIKDIQALAQNAVEAATKVRTWSQLIDTTKEALGSGWAETFEIIFGDFNEATELWSEVSKVIGEVIDKQADARNQLLTGWKDSGGRQDLIDAVKNVFAGVQEILKPVQEAFTNIFPPLTVQNLVDFTKKLKELTSKFKLSTETTENLRKTFEGLFSGVKIVGQAFGAFFKALSPVWDIVKKVAGKVLEFTGDLGKLITKVSKASDELGLFDKISGSIKTALETLFGAVGGFVGPVIDKIDEFRKKIVDAFSDAIEKSGKLEGPFGEVIKIFDSVKTKAGELFTAITGYVTQKFGTIDTTFLTSFAGTWSDIISNIKTEYGGIPGILQSFADKVKEYAAKAGLGFSDLGKALSDFGKSPIETVKVAIKSLIGWFGSLPEKLESVKDGVGGLITSLVDLAKEKFKAPDLSSIFNAFDILTGRKIDTNKVAEAANSAAETITKSFDNSKISALKQAVTKFAGFIKSAIDFINKNMNFDEVLFTLGRVSTILAGFGIDSILFSFSKLEKSLAKVVKGFKEIGKSVTKVVDEFQNTVKSFNGLIDGAKDNLKSLTESVSDTIESFQSIPKSISGVFDQLKESIGNIGKTRKIDKVKEIAGLILMLGISIRLLASSIKIFSEIDTDTLAVSIMGVSSLIIALGGTSLLLSQYGGEAKTNSISILALAVAVNILAKAVQKIGEMGTAEAIQGGIGALAALGGLAASSYWIGKTNFDASAGLGLIEMAGALLIIQKAMEKFAELDPQQFIVGGALVAAALTGMSIAASKIGEVDFGASSGLGLIGMSAALVIMSKALEEFGKLNILDDIVPGLLGMGGALAELTIALNHMDGTTKGAVALGILAVAMIPMAKAFSMMSEISFGQIVTGLLGFGGALAAILVASALISPFSGGLIALAAALAAFGIVVIGLGAGLSALTLALTTLATVSTGGLAAVIGAFGILAEGILDTLIKLTPKVTQFIAGLIEQMCEIMMAKKQFVFETGFTLLLTILDMLAERGPELIDKLAQVIIMVLDGLKLYGPEIVEKAVELAVSLFSTIIDTLNKQDPDTLIHAVEAFAGISALMVVCAGLSELAVPAMKGLGELGVFVAELIAIVSLIGGLGQIPGFTWLINEGGKVLEAVGLAIGGFFGGIVGGVVKGATSVLPQVGTQISQFMENADYFLKHISEVGDDQKNGAKNLASIITSLTGASLLDSIVNIISEGGQRYSRLGSELSSFAKTAQPFFDSMKDLGVSGGIAMVGVNAIASAVMTLTKQKILDGITSFITGGSSLKSFGEELKAFGPSVKEYAKETEGINGKAVEGSANAIKILAKAAKALPNDGGVIAYWTGDNSLEDFGAQLKAFGPNLKAYANEVKDIDSDSVEGSANAIKVLSRAAKVIPNSGGKIAAWLGDNKLDDFGAQLVSFGPDLASYAESVKDISEKKVKASARAAEALAGLANNLPETGGFLQAFLGEQSLEDFGDDLESFGTSLATYSGTIENIGEDDIKSSAAAAATLVALANDLPEDKGMFGKLFGGEQNLETFGKNLKAFGGYMVEYYNSVKDIPTTNNLYGIGTIASKMIDVAVAVSETDVKNLKSLGENIWELGSGEYDYYHEVSDIDFDKVSKSITQINRLVGLADVLKDFNSDLFTTFGSAMKSLANAGISDFEDAFDEAYDDCIKAINSFVAAMSKGVLDKKEDMSSAGNELGAEVPSGLITGMNSKGRDINDTIITVTGAIVSSFKSGLAKKTFEGIGSDATTAISTGFSSPGAEILSTITTLTGGIVKQFTNGLPTSTFIGIGKDIINGLKDGVNDPLSVSGLSKSVSNIATAIQTAFNDTLTYDSAKTITVNVVNGLTDGLTGGQYYLNTAVYTVASGAVTTLKNNMTYDQGKNVGVNIINGLIDGINNGSYYVNNAVQNMANSGVQTLQNTWQVHSPSKVAYRIGDDIDAGLANGIADGGRRVIQAAENVSEDTQDAFGDLDDGMSQSFEDSIDLSDEAADSIGENTQTAVDGMNLTSSAVNSANASTSEFTSSLNSTSGSMNSFIELITKANDLLKTFCNNLTTLKGKLLDLISAVTNTQNTLNTFVETINKVNNKLTNVSTAISNVTTVIRPLDQALLDLNNTLKNVQTAADKAYKSLSNYNTEYKSTTFTTPEAESKSDKKKKTDATKAQTKSIKEATKATDETNKYADQLSKAYEEAAKQQHQSTTDFGDYTDVLKNASEQYGTSTDGYHMSTSSGTGYGSGYGSYSTSGQDVSDVITDEMRNADVDLNLDLSTGSFTSPDEDVIIEEVTDSNDSLKQATKELAKEVKENTKSTNKANKQSKSEKKKNKKVTVGKTDEISIIDDETTATIKTLADQMVLSTTSNLVDNTSNEMKQAKEVKQQQEDSEKQMQDMLNKYMKDANSTENKATNIENTNVFNIRSTDPKQAADEIGVMLQKQVERGKAVWGL